MRKIQGVHYYQSETQHSVYAITLVAISTRLLDAESRVTKA